MYACLHRLNPGASDELLDLALQFSPVVEVTRPDTIVFAIGSLRKLIGPPHQIASEICRYGYERKIQANLAIASNPDAAVLLACHLSGVTLVTPGEERFKIAPIPLPILFAHTTADPGLLQVLQKWGLKTCGDLAQLPETGLAERLGQPGIHLRRLALGIADRPLRLCSSPSSYSESVTLEHPIDLLEPILFLLGRALGDLCGRLRKQSQAARSVKACFVLENSNPDHIFNLEFPVPLDDTKTLLKLIQLNLERHRPSSAITAFRLDLEPAEARRVQEDFFSPPAPAPEKLQITLARIASMVGAENVGSPHLLNTYRSDAFEMVAIDPSIGQRSYQNSQNTSDNSGNTESILHLSMRIFRPALQARVRVAGIAPRIVAAAGVKGNVLRSAGPWKTSGEWWAKTAWIHEEWDVALDDGALYRIYQDTNTHTWFVQGVYD